MTPPTSARLPRISSTAARSTTTSPALQEKEVFAFSNIADELVHYMLQNGAYMLNPQQVDALVKTVLVEKQDPKTGKRRVSSTANASAAMPL